MKNNIKYNLFLDDFRDPRDSAFYTGQVIYNLVEWEVVRNYDEFIKIIIERGIPEIISLDHDLVAEHYGLEDYVWNNDYDQFKEKTGYHCAKWLIDYCIDNKLELPTEVLIHSMNPVGSANIRSLFDSYWKSLKM